MGISTTRGIMKIDQSKLDRQNKALDIWEDNDSQASIEAATGFGKCLGRDTLVLMYNGTIKKVQNIEKGDLLMGHDSTPRTVQNVNSGQEEMFEIIPTKGESWTCNKSHILSLVCNNKTKTTYGKIVDISVKEYLDKTKTFKHTHKLISTGVTFSKNQLPIHPYLLGLWLGDGTTSDVGVKISNPDNEIYTWCKKHAKDLGIKLNVLQYNDECPTLSFIDPNATGQKANKLTNEFRKIDLYDNKHIPHIYKTGNRKQRLELLAGLIDTDGYLDHTKVGFEITQKSEQLIDDIIYLVRSLGLACYKTKKIGKITSINFEGEYYRIHIIGDTVNIPTRIKRKQACERKQIKDPLRNGFKIKSIGIGDYYGFTLKEDPHFLLGNFTITHNTYMGILGIKRKLKKHSNLGTIIVVPTDYLRNKWNADINHFGLRDHVKVDTIHSWVKHDKLGCHLLILDEIHGYTGGEVFSTIFDRVNYQYILGLTAKERDKEEDKKVLDEYCPIVDRIPLSECLANGWISPFVIYNWGLELPKADRITYDKMHTQFIKYFSTFDFKLNRMYRALMDEDFRESLAKATFWEPEVIMVHAAQANRIMQKRKAFLQSHPLLLEKAVRIIDNFSDRRIITFSETTDFVDQLHEAVPNSVVYHSSMNTVVRDKDSGKRIAEGKKVKIGKSDKTRYFDSDNEPLTWKQIKFKYKDLDLERFSGDRRQEESLKAFSSGKVDIIHAAKALNEGVDIQNLDFSIKTSFNSTIIDSTQRSGRIARIDDENPDKRAIEVNLYFKNTQSEKWLRSSQKNGPETQEITSIEEIV